MESEDDMHDANDAEYIDDDDDFYSGETAMDSDDDAADYEFIDNDSDDSDDLASYRSQQNYTILSEADIHECQEEYIMKISAVLSISSVAAGILLRHYNWSVSKVNDEWFADEEKVRKVVGLVEKPVPLPNIKELNCGICFEVYPRDGMSAAACGHPFCVTCWQGYISTAINDGPGCLMLRCPDPSCGAAVGQDMINVLSSGEDKEKLCLGAWSDHGERTGGFYACNRYEAAKQEGVSRQKALADLHQMQTVHLEKLSDKQCQPESQLKFIIEAWLQAESGLERLHQCAEKELQGYLNAEGPSKDFNEFRTKLAGLTRGKGTAARSSSCRNIDDSGHWSCEYCTFANARTATVCQMCQQRR
ncbi:hypothetical protein RJ639_045450 [Escallonia herrerae]|uniref:RBR-type E3 ubiquitin transferase n=1 Tax=Escallonia herrerae TaxID=1293975 RepID=A0AA88W675_9ASTE|nr:hypothetical protein RJ639_045450 [Escallonia herrerae]